MVAKILQMQQTPQLAEPPEPPPNECWSDVAKQRRERGDLPEALEAAWNAIQTEGPAYCRLYLSILQQFAGRFPRPLAEARAALDRLTQVHGPHLDESDLLRIVHLKMRYLGVPDGELGKLDRPYESRWNLGAALVIRAWLQIRKGEGFGLVSRLCRDGRQTFEAMPEGGGDAGAYARAYLNLIDGVAHIGYVSSNGQVDYYIDALDCFSRSFVLASRIDAGDLVQATFRWLDWLGRLTSFCPDPPLSQVYLGVKAILQSHGLASDGGKALGVPEIPAYDEEKLFPL